MPSGLSRTLRSVSFRLACWHSLLFVLTSLLILGAAFVELRRLASERDRDATDLRLSLVSSEYERGGVDAVGRMAAFRNGRGQRTFFVRIMNPSGETVFRHDAEAWAEFEPAEFDHSRVSDESGVLWSSISRGRLSMELASRRLPDGSVLQVGRSTASRNRLLDRFSRLGLIALLGALPVGFVAGGWISFRSLAPVRKLTATAMEIVETGRFGARVATTGADDEIDRLVVCFNDMLGRMERLVRSLHDSLDNVAHDLRTPLTRLQGAAQSALLRPGEPAMQLEALAVCMEETEQVMTILGGLMDIAEAEAGIAAFSRVPVPMEALLNDVVDLYREVAEEKTIAVSVATHGSPVALGDPGALRRVVANLLDNALKYTGFDGQVELSAVEQAGVVTVTVSDNGAGIVPEELPLIWQKLFRGDRSRSKPGSGLGLGIVKALVEAHDGSVDVQSEPNLGSRFFVTLPSA